MNNDTDNEDINNIIRKTRIDSKRLNDVESTVSFIKYTIDNYKRSIDMYEGYINRNRKTYHRVSFMIFKIGIFCFIFDYIFVMLCIFNVLSFDVYLTYIILIGMIGIFEILNGIIFAKIHMVKLYDDESDKYGNL